MTGTVTPPAAPTASRAAVPVLAACGVVVALVQTMVVPLLPQLPRLIHTTADNAGWLLTTTLLTGAVGTPVLGRMGDMYGRTRMLRISLAVLGLGSVLCAVSNSLPLLLVGRALQGTALSVIPLGISILREILPPARLLPAVSLMSSTVGIGAAAGLPVAALITEKSNWHTMFWAVAGVAAVALVLVRLILPRSAPRTGARFDLLGALGLTVVLVSVLLAISKGGTWGWNSPVVLGLVALAAVTAAIWARHEKRSAAPLVDLAVSVRRPVLLTNVATLLIGFAFYANSLITVQLVQEPGSSGYGLGVGMLVASLCLLPGGLCLGAFSPVSARISARWGARTSLALASGLIAAGYLVRLFTSHSLTGVVLGTTVVAIGSGVAYSAMPALIMSAVPASETGAANGLNMLVRTLGQTVCAAVTVLILTHVTATVGGHTGPSFGAYQLLFVLSGVLALVALAATLLVPRATHQILRATT